MHYQIGQAGEALRFQAIAGALPMSQYPADLFYADPIDSIPVITAPRPARVPAGHRSPGRIRRAVRVVVESSQQAMEIAGVTADDLALVIPHQANIRIIQAVVDRLGIGMDRAVIALDRYGNTSSASIPLAFDVARKEGRIKAGDYALLTGFGAGMTWASSVVKWSY